MKKVVAAFVCLLLMALFCCAIAESESNFVVFGRYEQDDNVQNGAEPIEWIVLETRDNHQMLISRYALDCMQYNEESVGVWSDSTIRTWLNEEFMQTAFTPEEQSAIVSTEVSNAASEGNDAWEISDQKDTEDSVFLLSFAEAKNYFEGKGALKVRGTEYARTKGAKLFGVTTIGVGETDWWLRSPGKGQKDACFVDVKGAIGTKNAKDKIGIRPVLWLDMSSDSSSFSDARYAEAVDLAERSEDNSAIEVFDSLGNYRDSMMQTVACRIRLGDKEFEQENYAGAIKWYEDTKAFIFEHYEADAAAQIAVENDLFTKLLESKYRQAVSTKDAGDIDGAIDMLTALGHYRDSLDLLRVCYDQKHIQYSWLTRKTDSTVNAGKDTGYSKTNPIVDGDPHFGWYLGRFMMSGYTERIDEGDMPVFIKTPGDNLILWFNLEQDIDALNQDASMMIERDKNGSDQQFQIPKSDFGRGALFIRHIDARNSDTDPQEYKDFLAAHDDTGANTKVEIKEEGIYEVALDYEIVKKTKIALVEKPDYYDYRICFSFEVRNGSGMFYLFDLESGTELQDYSTTTDGFRIDLANSHVLSINYTRYALNQSGTGLDVRKATVASDGDEFTTVGYYEITATNKETNEKLTKHIFIGDSEDLAMYKEADSELLSRFE